MCVNLYRAIVKLLPEWHSENDLEDKLKIVMTGSATDPGNGGDTSGMSAAVRR